jgi:alpha-glucosidase
MRQVVDAYPDRVLIGEIYLPLERLVTYYGENLSGVHLPFNFQLLFTSWKASPVAALIDQYERVLPAGAWPNWVLGNHDQRRIATRVGTSQARVAAMLLLTLRGTPTLYYGDEIGMHNVPIAPETAQDPWERREPGLGVGGDPQRTPMQWDASPSAGFSGGTPWLPIASDYPQTNIASQREDPTSILSLHRQLIALRSATPALRYGAYRALSVIGDVLCYERAAEDQRLLVALNFGDRPAEMRLSSWSGKHVLLSTDRQCEGSPLPHWCCSQMKGSLSATLPILEEPPHDQRPLVQKRHYLLPVGRYLHGCQR